MLIAKKKVACEMEITLNVIGGKWKPLIIYYIAQAEKRRFGEIKNFLVNISQKVLTNQLRELEKDGVLQRRVFNEIPPKVEYFLTLKGKSLLPVLEKMCEWGEANIGDDYELICPLC